MRVKNQKTAFVLIAIIMAVLVLLTRFLCLTHNFLLHPDEVVFYNGSINLKDYLLGNSDSFSEIKVYPEGTYIFQAVFYILSDVAERLFNKGLYYALGVRVASVVYYSLGTVVALFIIYRYFTKKQTVLISYAITAVFSLFDIEQSRYGTGEAVSFFLLMLVICLCCEGLYSKCWIHLIAFYVVGVLAAVKYPLVYFVLFPLSAILINTRINHKKKTTFLIFGILLMVTGFFMFSPKAAQDISYISEVVNRETGAYISEGNRDEIGGFFNHLAETIIYWFFYAGVPLAPIFFFYPLFGNDFDSSIPCGDSRMLKLFIRRIIPCVAIIFLTYNLFTTTLFFRTLYPFFNIASIYTSLALGHWMELKEGKRWIAAVSVLLLLFRGSYLVFCMYDDDCNERFAKLVQEEGGDQAGTVKCMYAFHEGAVFAPYYPGWEEVGLIIVSDLTDYDFQLEKDTFIYTDSLNYRRCQPYIFPIDDEITNNAIENWEKYCKDNEQFLAGSVYPDYYYYLFGYWLKCSTGTSFEFPSTVVFYNS